MKIFKFTYGDFTKYGVFKDLKEAEERRTEIEDYFSYLHVIIEEFTIPHYNIILEPTEDLPFVPDEAEELREALRAAGISFHTQLGLKRLRDLAEEYNLRTPDPETDAI